jgi:flagella basal body P-ring formation protein FlgA
MGSIEKTGTKRTDSGRVLVILAFITVAVFCQASGYGRSDEGQKDSALHVYLPREITIENDHIMLGEVGVVRGQEAFAAIAKEIALGRISLPGQKIVVSRSTVLSRLACSGIPASKVQLSGAEKITVMRRHQVIQSIELLERAESFLRGKLPAGSVCEMKPTRQPKDLVILGTSRDVQLSPRLVRSGAHNQARVQVTAVADGKEIGTREAIFQLKYNRRQAVALVDIPVGTAISAENVRIEKVPSNYPEPVGWRPPYGLIAKRDIAADGAIDRRAVAPAKPPLLLKRNQTVVVRIEMPGLIVTAMGKALQDGHAGELIKVQNVDSKRTVLVKVNEDGTVEPLF